MNKSPIYIGFLIIFLKFSIINKSDGQILFISDAGIRICFARVFPNNTIFFFLPAFLLFFLLSLAKFASSECGRIF